MTAFPSTPSVDDLIRQNRARTPKAATEARKVPRSSIAELNEMDMDEIRDRYVAMGYDNRSPTTKVLDLIDLPRNVVANVLFNATGAVDPKNVRRGALGLPSISTSDALTSMGVKNRVVRGIVGFAGDVALDPLTYIGPAGWGLQVMDGAGRAVRIGKAGAKGLKRGVREVGSGARVSDNATRELFDTLLANAPDDIKAADNARKAAYLSERAMGQVGAKSKATAPFYYLNRGLGGDQVGRGGMIAEGLTKEGAEGDAVRAFVSRAGAAAGPGIGKGGSQIAHIPFTGTSAKVKGFTRAGRAAEEDLALARSAAPRPLNEIMTPRMAEAAELARQVSDYEKEIRSTADQSKAARQALEKQLEQVTARTPHGTVSGDAARLETTLLDHDRRSTERMLELRGQRDTTALNLQKLVEQQTALPAQLRNPREVFALRKVQEEISTAYELARKREASNVNADIARRINIDADQHADDTMEVWDRIIEQQTATKKGGPTKREEVVSGTNPVQNPDEVLNNPTLPESIKPMSLFEKRQKMRSFRVAMKKLQADRAKYDRSGQWDRYLDLKAAMQRDMELLRNTDGLHDITAGRLSGEGKDIAPPQYLPADLQGDILVPQDLTLRQQLAERARPILDQIDDAERELHQIGATRKAPERDSLFAADALGQSAVDAATLARETEYQQAVDRLLGLHAQLEAVTDAARRSPGVKAADAREAARMDSFNSVDTAERTLADMADEDIALAEEVADATHETMKAYQRHFDAVRGAVEEARKLDETDQMMVRMMSRFLGTDDQIVGKAALAGIDAMSRVPGADRAKQILDTTFGSKGTAIANEQRKLGHAFGPGWRREVQRYMGTVTNELRNAFRAVGVSPTGDDMDKAASLLHAFAIRDQAKRGTLEAGREILYTTDMTGQPSAMMKLIEGAAKEGMFDPKIYGDLTKRLEAIAQQYGSNLLEQLKNIELEQGVLKSARPGYFPNVATTAAKEAIARGRRYTQAAGQRAQSAAREAFQKERSTDQVRFVSQRPGMEGQQRRLFGFELDQAERIMEHPGELAGLRQEGYNDAADALEDLVADYREYMSLPERPRFRATDPYELNQMQNERRFDLLLDGIDPVGGFMQTNMLAALGDRVGQHARSLAREQWSQYVKQFGITIPGFRGYSDKSGRVLRSTSGAEAQVTKGIDSFGREVPVAVVGGQRYRPITVKYKDANDNPLISMLGKENVEPIYHEQVASAIERAADIFEGENPNVFLKGIDELTRHWKSITLLHPSWFIYNTIGDAFNAIIGGANPKSLFNPESAKFAAKAVKNMEQPDKLAGLTINIRGQQVDAQQIIDDALAEGVLDGTMMQETAFRLIENQLMTLSSAARGTSGAKRFKPSVISSDWKEMAQRYAIGRGRTSPNAADKARATHFVASDRYMNNVVGPWFRINSKASNMMRLQVFLSYLQDGYDVQSAARRTVRSQLDYSDLTRVERDVFRRMLPFYAFMRLNGAYQLRNLMERPIYAASFPKLKESLEEAINGDEKVPAQMRPNWMRSALALQVGSDPENRSAVLFGTGIPIADVYQHLTPLVGTDGVMDFMHYFASGLNPALNVPLQLATGHETFSGRKIGPDALSGDISAGEFLRNQIRPLAEYGPGGKIAKAIDQGGIGQGLGRVLLGGRVQDFSEERLTSSLAREFKEKEDRIRASIARAEREGNKEKSLAGRVKLLELMNAAQEAGVPIRKWASKQLQELNAHQ